MAEMSTPVDLIWGEQDPWEPIAEAKRWAQTIGCIRSLEVIPGAGHCPHDEAPKSVNEFLKQILQMRAQAPSPATGD